MYVMGGRRNILQQFREESVTIRHDVNLVILEGQGQILVDEQVHQRFLALRYTEVVLVYESQHRALGQLVHLTLIDDAFLAMVDAKKQVEHHADNRYEANDQNPRHRLGGLTVVHQHVDNGYCSSNQHQRITDVNQTSHLSSLSHYHV